MTVQLLIFAARKEGMSLEAFDEHWRNGHATGFLALPIVKKHCLKYEQYHHKNTEREQAEVSLGLDPSGWDGVGLVEFDSMEGAQAVFSDQGFLDFVTAEVPIFLGKMERVILMNEPRVMYKRDE
ncbi:hypothetical protein ASPZODRAFT_15463 [Penicilliopsis zonata CBS 506.65]|uniref:EthD domain-containing protein n=1 Tax=Penicilliopsis zonata CBS 506.65 TaxID=1073090 RepID=A0A1L9SLT7_9EURO|nr:hypothetical protein ASPZODRAFT_15463 [Penicilliopsis zonata CBS 506.65]OJJ48017.1 hypothetical protein ASPZODRAFT_15463 [Penicilliopsis zonata CBS 506.65]